MTYYRKRGNKVLRKFNEEIRKVFKIFGGELDEDEVYSDDVDGTNGDEGEGEGEDDYDDDYEDIEDDDEVRHQIKLLPSLHHQAFDSLFSSLQTLILLPSLSHSVVRSVTPNVGEENMTEKESQFIF